MVFQAVTDRFSVHAADIAEARPAANGKQMLVLTESAHTRWQEFRAGHGNEEGFLVGGQQVIGERVRIGASTDGGGLTISKDVYQALAANAGSDGVLATYYVAGVGRTLAPWHVTGTKRSAGAFTIHWTESFAREIAMLTEVHAGEMVLIILGRDVLMSPVIQEPIRGT